MIQKASYYYAQGTDPYQNIADESILLEMVEPGELILFLWQNLNTVVIGRNQNCWVECRVEELERDGGFLARRLSGGGAVYHDLGNVNFTFLVREKDFDLEKQNLVIKKAMEQLGLETERSGRNDLLIDGRKFSGHAYYKQGDNRYHHGTILVDVNTEAMEKYLSASKNKMQSKGVKSVRSRVANLIEFLPDLKTQSIYSAFITAAQEVYQLELVEKSLGDLDRNIRLDRRNQFSSPAWLYGPKLPLKLIVQERYIWGEVTLELTVEQGTIEEVRVYSDAMDWAWVEKFSHYLVGKHFQEEILLQKVEDFQTTETSLSAEQIEDLRHLVQQCFK